MTCPICAHAGEPLVSAQAIAVCAGCGLTCALDEAGTARQAVLEDLRALGDEQMRGLVKARARRLKELGGRK